MGRDVKWHVILCVSLFAVLIMIVSVLPKSGNGEMVTPDDGGIIPINSNVAEVLKEFDNGSRVKEVSFVPSKYEAIIIAEFSAAKDINELGFYYFCNATCVTPYCNGCRALYRLFNGSDGAGDCVIFDTRDDNPVTPDYFGLWLNSPNNHQDWHRALGGLYYSQPELNVEGLKHVLIFEITPRTSASEIPLFYLVLCEDWCGYGYNLSRSEPDYDDMIVLLNPQPTPSPSPTVTVITPVPRAATNTPPIPLR